jgi:plasmid stability protein
MASLTLKNVPEDLFAVLRQAAEQDRRSINQEVFYLLSSALQGRSHEAEVAQYRQAYQKYPEQPDELSGLLDVTNGILSELPWDDK